MITIITGVPGTGKTAWAVSELEKEAASGRVIFTNITGLKIPHYKLGAVSQWQAGTWLHIDQYQRTSRAQADDDTGEIDNWLPNPASEQPGYESHKGALIIIDEAQNFFRPRPPGSAVPDHVAALEVHRKQGIDFWLITQRPNLLDSNVRGLCGRHIALRSTAIGRYQYEWPEVGDIEQKASRESASRTRYRLPKHVFNLYKSAEVHTQARHSLPFMAKVLLACVPLFAFLVYTSINQVKQRTEKPQQSAAPAAQVHAALPASAPVTAPQIIEEKAPQFIDGAHPYQGKKITIVAYLENVKMKVYRFAISEGGRPFYVSSGDVRKAGYRLEEVNECTAKLTFANVNFFVNCGDVSEPVQAPSFVTAGVEKAV